jgi:alpha-beta hydrolase superfamily lysophospholipase
MTPVSFGGRFGWLHTPAAGGSDVAVLICPGIARDALLSHCSLRLLADDLANAGYTALRFDYSGTADSCDEGVDRAGGHWSAWRHDVHAAADWLREKTGARRLVICGLRAGAALATLAAVDRDDVAGLALLAPVLRGKSYLRQLQVEVRVRTDQQAPRSSGNGFAYREFEFSPATMAEIAAVDLRRTRPRAGQKVIAFFQAESGLGDECTEAWRAAGVDVMTRGWDGLGALLRHSVVDETVLADFSGLIAWLRQAVPAAAQGALAALPPAELRPPGCIETPLRFGADQRLFGMLCQPDGPMSETVVIISNGGRDPHYGAARHAVAFARRLARLGIASLRMDFAGLGDSIGPPGHERLLSDMMSVDRGADMTAAIDMLEGRGFRRFAVEGLCAGAYHAFHGALTDRRLGTLLLINIPMFTLPDGAVVDYLNWREMSPSVVMRKLPRPGSWVSLLQRRKDLDLGAILRVQLERLRAHAVNHLRHVASRLGLAPTPTFAQAALANLSSRGVRTLFIFSTGDAELDAFQQEFGRGLERYPGASWRVVSEVNHDLTWVAGRGALEGAMIDFLADAPA